MPSTAITVIHKFIRREMFDFAERLFRAEPHDAHDVRAALEDIAAILRGHAEHEDSRLAPLLHDLDPQFAERIAGEHARLEAQLEALCEIARNLDSSTDCSESLLQLHLDWNRFLSAYLAHLDEEERTLFRKLGDRVPKVGAIADSALAEGSAQGEAFLLRLWSVTTCAERMAIEAAIDAAAARDVALAS